MKKYERNKFEVIPVNLRKANIKDHIAYVLIDRIIIKVGKTFYIMTPTPIIKNNHYTIEEGNWAHFLKCGSLEIFKRYDFIALEANTYIAASRVNVTKNKEDIIEYLI